MSTQTRLGPFRLPSGGRLAAALRPDSTTIGLDDTRAISFDRAGRLVRAFWDGRSVRRSLDNRFVERRRTGAYPWSPSRRELDPAEQRTLVTTILRELAAVRASGLEGPEGADLAARLNDVLAWNLEALEADGNRFRSVYLPVPILPPDQYRALVVQVTEGCAYNQCTFCRFYRDRPFRAKSPPELQAHLRAIRDFFGEGIRFRTSVFLADANALILPPSRLAEIFDVLRAELPLGADGLRGVYSFIDAFTGAPKSVAQFRALAERGLRRVYLGLESGCDDLARFLEKPATAAEALDLVRALKEAGVGVGVIVLLGIGGDRYAERHLADTVAAVQAMGLGSGDILYLSPLAADVDSPYRRKEREAGIRSLTEAEIDAQLRRLKAELRFGPGGRPKVAIYDIRDFLY